MTSGSCNYSLLKPSADLYLVFNAAALRRRHRIPHLKRSAIADEHTLEIYHHLPNAQLVIFPGATHMIPVDDPALFNATVDRFFRTPFFKTDRVAGLIQTGARMKAEYAADHAAPK